MEKRTVLITGCSPGGIGYSLAREFCARGFHVIATARKRNVIADLEELGMTTLTLDVTSAESITAAKDEVSKLTGGKLDILVNNAGRDYLSPGIEIPMSEARLTFETNFFSVVLMTQTFIPLLIASEGLIANIGSVAGIMPYVFSPIYNASKAALHQYSSTLKLELEPFNVKVIVVVTGAVKSNIANFDSTLQSNSLYTDIRDEYKFRSKHSQGIGIDNVEYAKDVVREIMKENPKQWLWKGAFAWRIWFCSRVIGLWPLERMFRDLFGLNKLISIVKDQKRDGVFGKAD